MASKELETDFAAHTRLDLPDSSAQSVKQKKAAPSLGPSFALPPKLEPFILLAKSARGSAAAALVGQAVAAPGVYVFSELLEQASIKDLANSEQHQAQYRLLELFAYGTWADYDTKRDNYPTLTPDQETKLKQLTILTLATQSRSIPYSLLLSTLSLPSIPALEDLLISAFYADVLSGRLDQKAGVLEVTSAHGRDVRPSAPAPAAESMELDAPASSTGAAPSVADLNASLSTFLQRLTTLISSLDAHLSTLTADALNASELQSQHEERVKATIQDVAKTDGKGGSGKGGWKGKIEDTVRGAQKAAQGAASAMASAGQGFGGMSGPSGGGGDGMDLDQPGGQGGMTRGAGGSPAGRDAGGRTRKRGRNL
ncbi:hypothetical protein JCM11251_003324 [Rhodosporidiobolus azoricus]